MCLRSMLDVHGMFSGEVLVSSMFSVSSALLRQSGGLAGSSTVVDIYMQLLRDFKIISGDALL